MKDKDAVREEIARQTKEYLAKGRVIDRIPDTRVAPTNIEWIGRRGFDFTPWHKI